MKLPAYREIIAAASDKIKEAMAVPRAYEQRKRAELEMAKLDAAMAEAEQGIAEVASKYPVCFDALIEKIDDLALLERRKAQFERIVAEMFPADVPA
jgi:7-cyano-7-deazaguanine synthase in queuosine biosynthesis